MLTLRDFLHLPQLDQMVEQMIAGEPGLVVVAGLEARPAAAPLTGDVLLPSGRSTIFSILMQEIIEAHPGLRAAVVTKEKSVAQVPKPMRFRVVRSTVEPPFTYADLISDTVRKRPGLLVIDRLTPETAPLAFGAALSGLRVLSQLDTVLWGAEVAHQLVDLGVPQEQLAGLSWVFAVQRLARLCLHCRAPVSPDPAYLERLRGRYPHLAGISLSPPPESGKKSRSAPSPGFCLAEGCQICGFTGRYGDIAVFDVFHPERQGRPIFEQPSLLSLEEYMLRLAADGHLPLDDLFRLETGQLRRTYNLLAASEGALAEANTTLNRKLAELEAANRVLKQRTEVLISLHDMAQSLITSTGLDDLAAKVCRRASELCGADRAILYYLHSSDTAGDPRAVDKAEVLAVSGWDPSLIHRQLDVGLVFDPHARSDPAPFAHRPPGIPLSASFEGEASQEKLMAGLRVPLVSQERQVGLMIVHSTQKQFFMPGDIALLQTFANQAALAIQRAGLIEELRAKIVQLEAAQVELVKKERMERELELARQVQQSVIPKTFPQVPGYAFTAWNEPARQVGGDFYDVIALGDGHFGLVIGDVSDKGMPAALYMALTRSLILAEARRERSPRLVLRNVNRLLLDLGEPARFVTVFYGVVEAPTGTLTYARAGHDYPLLLRAGQVQPLAGRGSILGVLEEDELELTEERLVLEGGDRLVLYTDGMCDVVNPDGDFFELHRLQGLLKYRSDLPLPDLCASVFAELHGYQGSAEQFDDMSMLVMEVV